MGLWSEPKKKRTPAQVQARLKTRLEKKEKLAKAKAENRKLRERISKLG